ncbi:pentapeptide repeat-containing protein [Streptomyces sp. NPDC054961]
MGLPWLVWKGPYLLDARYIDEKAVGAGTGSAALVTGLRTSLVACAAALGAGIALLYTARTYRLTRRGQVTDRFTKALERLGSDKLYVRIGGILALEQIVQDAPEQATDAARVLQHFLRESAPRARTGTAVAGEPDGAASAPTEPLSDEPAADVQVALTALTRRESRTHVDPREVLQLGGLHLVGARLHRADLTSADLSGADLTGADLRGADLTCADLRGADLTRACLNVADFTQALATRATFTGAAMIATSFTWTDLHGASLEGTSELRQAQIDAALLDSATTLPSHLVRKR